MYKIKYNDAVICTPQFKEFAAIAGKLQEGLNAVSVFSFTLPPKHPYLDSMEGRNGLVKLCDDDNVLFIGDIVNRKENFDCTTEIECQDALGWLNDVVFVKPTFSGAIENYWVYLLGRYNQEASEWRKINIGTVTVQGNISISHETEFLTIFDLVSELTQLSDGYVSVRYEGEEIFLDYLAQANTESDQSILFGTNLINLEDFVSEEQIFSRVYPRGKDGLDISSVNGGLTYLTNGTTESMFGIVAVTVDFDTESATELKALGQAYLEANGLASRTLTLTAFNLSLVDKNYTEIKVGNIVPVISPPHGINTKMQVNAKTTDIVTPENSTFTLGLILNTISGIMASGGTTSKTISGQDAPPAKITGAVRYDITQTLIDSEKARARANIGAGTSNFDGRYSSLSGKPTIPTNDSALSSTSTNPVQNKVVKAALDGKLDKSGGTLTGNLTGKYLTGTWLQTTQASDLNSKPDKIAVLDGSGWVYYRTPAELASDIGVVAPADYIVEKGTSNGWQYRKWNSGVAECWRDLSVSGKACSTAVGSWFRTGSLSVGAYPFTFTAAPNLQMQFETFEGTGGLVWSTGTASSNPKTRPANIYIIRMASAASITGTVHYYAIGKWK